MKLTEEIIITKSHYAPAGAALKRYSISDKPIDILIANLLIGGIDINRDISEKEVIYTSKSKKEYKEKTANISLQFLDEIPIAFYLRDLNGLELELRNYDKFSQRPLKGRYGGLVAGEFGIICKLSIEGDSIDTSLIDNVREAMNKTYEVNKYKTDLIDKRRNMLV